jgi:hydrogenase maturation factor HypE
MNIDAEFVQKDDDKPVNVTYENNDTEFRRISLCINELLRLKFDENLNEALINEKTILLLLYRKYNIEKMILDIESLSIIEEYQAAGWIVERVEMEESGFVWVFQVKNWHL